MRLLRLCEIFVEKNQTFKETYNGKKMVLTISTAAASEGWRVVEEYGDNLRSRRRWGLDLKQKAMLLMIDVE